MPGICVARDGIVIYASRLFLCVSGLVAMILRSRVGGRAFPLNARAFLVMVSGVDQGRADVSKPIRSIGIRSSEHAVLIGLSGVFVVVPDIRTFLQLCQEAATRPCRAHAHRATGHRIRSAPPGRAAGEPRRTSCGTRPGRPGRMVNPARLETARRVGG